MPGIAIIGAQFGDEGKGKVTDFFAKDADIIVRYQGGNNAGHTVVVDSTMLKLHLLPSGVAHGKKVMIAAGVAIDPGVLEEEIKVVNKFKPVDLTIDPRAHIIFPYHILLDEAREGKKSKSKIGTTKRGIGPCYADRHSRIGIRFEDLVSPNLLKKRLHDIYPINKAILEKVFKWKVNVSESCIFSRFASLGKKFAKNLGDVSTLVYDALEAGKTVMFEGAQGTFLDVDFGTYPYVTSSHPISGGIATGVGLPTGKIGRIIGVVKAYTTRVGDGPFPAEIKGKEADLLRKKGNEFGTTTGRPRRVGWLDLPMLRTANRLNGFTELAVTKLDVLSGTKKLKLAVAYKIRGKNTDFFPYNAADAASAKPIYAELPGFEFSPDSLKSFDDLPKSAQDYLHFLEHDLKVPIKMISIGAERGQTILRGD